MYKLGSASLSEVFTRVAYQLIKLDYMNRRERYYEPHVAVYELSRELSAAGFRALSTWVLAYSIEMQRGARAHEVRLTHLRRALRASSFRAVLHADYKANRRP